jgi:hypothetical protein
MRSAIIPSSPRTNSGYHPTGNELREINVRWNDHYEDHFLRNDGMEVDVI